MAFRNSLMAALVLAVVAPVATSAPATGQPAEYVIRKTTYYAKKGWCIRVKPGNPGVWYYVRVVYARPYSRKTVSFGTSVGRRADAWYHGEERYDPKYRFRPRAAIVDTFESGDHRLPRVSRGRAARLCPVL